MGDQTNDQAADDSLSRMRAQLQRNMEVVDNVKRFKEKGILDETHSRDKLDAQLIRNHQVVNNVKRFKQMLRS